MQVTIWIYIFQLLLIHAVWSAREEMQEAHLLHYLLIVRSHKSHPAEFLKARHGREFS